MNLLTKLILTISLTSLSAYADRSSRDRDQLLKDGVQSKGEASSNSNEDTDLTERLRKKYEGFKGEQEKTKLFPAAPGERVEFTSAQFEIDLNKGYDGIEDARIVVLKNKTKYKFKWYAPSDQLSWDIKNLLMDQLDSKQTLGPKVKLSGYIQNVIVGGKELQQMTIYVLN